MLVCIFSVGPVSSIVIVQIVIVRPVQQCWEVVSVMSQAHGAFTVGVREVMDGWMLPARAL